MSKVRVMIVDDSLTAQILLKEIIEKDPELKVAATVSSAEEALENLNKISPDVITIDIILPKMDGYELTKKLVKETTIPVVIISGRLSPQAIAKSFLSLEAGAVSILTKPAGPLDPSFEEKSNEIRWQIKHAVGGSKVSLPIIKHHSRIEAIAIGTSLGGPQALKFILSSLPATFPVPLYIVQHISPGFTEGMVQWLQNTTPLNVKLATHYAKGMPGHAYIAPDSHMMSIDQNNRIVLTKSIEQPSVASLFASMASNLGHRGAGIILTGMGKDGAQELADIKSKGGFTIAQDKESSIMFGMPSEAIKLGGATKVLSLQQIPSALIQLVR